MRDSWQQERRADHLREQRCGRAQKL